MVKSCLREPNTFVCVKCNVLNTRNESEAAFSDASIRQPGNKKRQFGMLCLKRAARLFRGG